jgi:hypothetical protein
MLMRAVKSLSWILLGLLVLVLGVPGAAHAQKPPTVTVEVVDVPKEVLPLDIVYNYGDGDVRGSLGWEGVTQDDGETELGDFKGVTLGGTFVPADGKSRDVEVGTSEGAKLRIRLTVTVWRDRNGDIYVNIRIRIRL